MLQSSNAIADEGTPCVVGASKNFVVVGDESVMSVHIVSSCVNVNS